jgi:5-methylthioadenosine/S-adenosylhomocysteine deaminase
LYNGTSHLIYAAKSTDVETVIINGKIVMENRRLTHLNVEKVMDMAEKAKERLLERLKANIK